MRSAMLLGLISFGGQKCAEAFQYLRDHGPADTEIACEGSTALELAWISVTKVQNVPAG